MPDPVTTNMQFAVPTRGSDVGTWDAPLNGDWNIADSAFGSVTSVALSNVNVTLTITQAQSAVLSFSGTLTGNVIVTLPAIQKSWTIINNTTGAHTVQLSTPSSWVIGVPPGNPVDVFSTGTQLFFKGLEPIGTYIDLAYASAPDWMQACSVSPYLPADGSTFSAVTYPVLAGILGTTTLPDLRGRARFFLNGTTGRITTAGSGIDGDTRFSAGGLESVVLSTSQIPAHTHTGTTGGQSADHTHPISNVLNNNGPFSSLVGTGPTPIGTPTISTSGVSNDHSHTFTSNNTGGGLLHQNMPPTLISGITMIRAA